MYPSLSQEQNPSKLSANFLLIVESNQYSQNYIFQLRYNCTALPTAHFSKISTPVDQSLRNRSEKKIK